MNFTCLIKKEKDALGKGTSDAAFGLALSGGGIRSSTFSLGVIQHLAQLGLLKRLGYLSTVSGGGYVGSWLSAWIKEKKNINAVEQSLVPRPEAGAEPDEAEQITWLRKYGKFLAPKSSLFSADTWAIVAIWVRNTLLNLTVLISCLMAAIALPWFVELGYHATKGNPPETFFYLHQGLATAATLIAMTGSLLSGKGGKRFWGPLAAFLLCVSSIFYTFGPGALYPTWSYVWGGLLTSFCAIGMIDQKGAGKRSLLLRSVLGIGLGGWVMGSVPPLLQRLENSWTFFAPIALPAVISFSYCLLLTGLIGLLGTHMSDERREWWSRVGAWMSIFGLVWGLLACIGLVGPSAIDFLRERSYIGVATGSLWAGLTGAGVYLGQSASTGPGKSSLVDKFLPMVPPVFMLGLLLLVARLVALLVLGWSAPRALEPLQCLVGCAKSSLEPELGASWHNVWDGFALAASNPNPDFTRWLICIAAFLGLYLAMGALIDVNEFSMHRFYRNRLVRGFQGAARGRDRHADGFTNMDPDDDVKMVDLQKGTYSGPIHLVNTAINMSLGETGLEERHASSFVFTPYGCGYSVGADAAGHCREYPVGCDLRLGTR